MKLRNYGLVISLHDTNATNSTSCAISICRFLRNRPIWESNTGVIRTKRRSATMRGINEVNHGPIPLTDLVLAALLTPASVTGEGRLCANGAGDEFPLLSRREGLGAC